MKLNSLFCYTDSLKKMIRSNIFTDANVVISKLLIMVKHATTFFNRAAKQIGISHLTGEHLKSVKKSVVSDHLFECSCSIDHYVQKV